MVHCDKYDYSEVNYINKTTKIKIKCLKCNETFEQIPEVHLRGSNCPKCANKESGKKQKITFDEFIPFPIIICNKIIK
jgi:hypothetical protein